MRLLPIKSHRLVMGLALSSALFPQLSFAQMEPMPVTSDTNNSFLSAAKHLSTYPNHVKSLSLRQKVALKAPIAAQKSGLLPSSSKTSFKANTLHKVKTKNPSTISDPELQPLTLYEKDHAKAQQESGQGINRLLFGLIGVLVLFAAFARWALPTLITRYPNIVEQLRQRYAANQASSTETPDIPLQSATVSDDEDSSQQDFPNASSTLALLGSITINADKGLALHLVSAADHQLLISNGPEGLSILCDLSTMTERLPSFSPPLLTGQEPPTTEDFSSEKEPLFVEEKLPFSSVEPSFIKSKSPLPAPPIKPSQSQLLRNRASVYAQAPKMTRQPVVAGRGKNISKKSSSDIELLQDYDDTF
jgi:hypothetical protein